MPFNQIQIIALISIATGFAIFLFMLYFAIVSWQEDEPRATKWAMGLTFLLPIPYLGLGLLDFSLQTAISPLLLILTALALAIPLLPIGNRFGLENDRPHKRIDERDIMFSRKLLPAGSERFTEYYKHHPEKKTLDDKFRKRPGLMQKGALYYDPLTSAAAEASFIAVSTFHTILDKENLPPNPQQIGPTQMTRFIKQWTKKLGAVSVGITKLQNYHLYSTIGRGDRYGEAVELKHKYAIALTVEMDKVLLDRAPYSALAWQGIIIHPRIQAKLKVGPAGDTYEYMSDQAMNVPRQGSGGQRIGSEAKAVDQPPKKKNKPATPNIIQRRVYPERTVDNEEQKLTQRNPHVTSNKSYTSALREAPKTKALLYTPIRRQKVDNVPGVVISGKEKQSGFNAQSFQRYSGRNGVMEKAKKFQPPKTGALPKETWSKGRTLPHAPQWEEGEQWRGRPSGGSDLTGTVQRNGLAAGLAIAVTAVDKLGKARKMALTEIKAIAPGLIAAETDPDLKRLVKGGFRMLQLLFGQPLYTWALSPNWDIVSKQ